MDNNEVKFAEVSRGATHAKQKERSAAFCVQFWKSESMVVNMLLVVVMTVCVYMISGVENMLKPQMDQQVDQQRRQVLIRSWHKCSDRTLRHYRSLR